MMLPSAPVRIAAAAAVLAIGLVGVVVREGLARAGGQEVRLAITGYDPRSLLSGHYVQFQIQEAAPCPPGADESSTMPQSWVALRGQGDRHVASGVDASRAKAAALGDLVVQGSVICFGSDAPVTAPPAADPSQSAPATPEPRTIQIDLGVDRIHLDQAQAEALDKRLRGRDDVPAFAVFSIDAAGKARLKGLIVEGRRYDLDWW